MEKQNLEGSTLGMIRSNAGQMMKTIGPSPPNLDEVSDYLGPLMLAGEYRAARDHAERWHQQDRKNPNNAYVFARFLLLEDPDAGLKWYSDLTNQNSGDTNWVVLLSNLQSEAGRGHQCLATIRGLLSRTTNWPHLFGSLAFHSLFVPDLDPVENLAAMRKLAPRHYGTTGSALWSVSKRPRYNIGFVCGNLRKHAISAFMMPLLTGLDRKKFMTVIFSSSNKVDAVTQELQKMCDMWYDTSGMTDPELLALIRADRLDILIDLDNHTHPNRLWVFAQRAAPIQMSFYGLNVTTGLDSIDYRLTDRVVDPVGNEAHYTEKLLRTRCMHTAYLGTTFPCTVAPYRSNGSMTFGSFNHSNKIDRTQVESWAAVLKAQPDSRLIIVGAGDAFSALRLERWMAEAGIGAHRVVIEGRLTPREFYERIQSVDLAIDSWPFGGGVTTATILSLGVPVVTALGPRAQSRVSAAMLQELGLERYVVESPDQLAARVAEICGDPESLSNRLTIAEHFSQTIGDGKRLAAEVGELLIRAIERYRQGKPADHDIL